MGLTVWSTTERRQLRGDVGGQDRIHKEARGLAKRVQDNHDNISESLTIYSHLEKGEVRSFLASNSYTKMHFKSIAALMLGLTTLGLTSPVAIQGGLS